MAIIDLNKDMFEKLTKESEKPVLVDFWAQWCVYCRRIAPAYDKLAEEMDEVVFAKVNIDDEPKIAEQEKIEVIPTFVLYKNGQVLNSVVAPGSKAQLEEFIRTSLGQ